MSPVCILTQEKRILGNANLFINNRSSNYPFIHEITSVFDLNTAKSVDASQISFKSLYSEYTFYQRNLSYFSIFFKDFSTKYLIGASEDFLSYILVTHIIYNNFFLNLKNVGGFFEKSVYSFSLNFIILYNLTKLYTRVSTVSYLNTNFISDLSGIYLANVKNVLVKGLEVAETSNLLAKTGASYNSYSIAYNKYSNYFSKTNVSLVNVFKE
jgi:hypothetical protein